MGEWEGEAVDLSDAPKQADEWEWGENPLSVESWEDGAWFGAGQLPAVGGLVKFYKTNVHDGKANEVFQELFDGEDVIQNLIELQIMFTDLGKEMFALVNDVKALANADIGDIVGWLVAAGLEGLTKWVQPIEDAWGYVVGNPRRLKTAKDMWDSASESLKTLAGEYAETATNTVDAAWMGYSNTGAQTRTKDFVEAIEATAGIATLLGMVVDLFADFSNRLISFINNVIVDLIATLVDALKDGLTKGPYAAITVSVDVEIILAKTGLELTSLVLRAATIFLAGAELTNQVAEKYEAASDLLDFLENVPATYDTLASQDGKE
ncbi:hypothetical protein [Haloglycomyces albus]|uniref:hypothetical protein n=1 Tax=Haloglycomyces albus TaxID=526067 RepID=UPI00046D4DF7|nr:hypothetical protein [Haloglycomyces albus]